MWSSSSVCRCWKFSHYSIYIHIYPSHTPIWSTNWNHCKWERSDHVTILSITLHSKSWGEIQFFQYFLPSFLPSFCPFFLSGAQSPAQPNPWQLLQGLCACLATSAFSQLHLPFRVPMKLTLLSMWMMSRNGSIREDIIFASAPLTLPPKAPWGFLLNT